MKKYIFEIRSVIKFVKSASIMYNNAFISIICFVQIFKICRDEKELCLQF